MSVFDVIALFGGLAMFLYGMRLMSSGLKDNSTGTLKKIMLKVTNNMFSSFLLGLAFTALIQSSTATIVITSGLVAANILTLRQSLGIIVGANVGTTVTGQIIRLMDLNTSSTQWLQFLKPSTLAPLALIAGIILIMFVKGKQSDTLGTICMGFGILFIGLMNMTDAVSVLNDSGVFDKLFMMLGDNPFLGYAIGAGVAFILQSSSATIGILQAFSVSGLLMFKSIYGVLTGVYLGDCVTTAIVCSIGAKAEARRVGVVHIIFNLGKTLLVFLGMFIASHTGILADIWNESVNSGVIANTNTIFNLASAALLFPFLRLFEQLSIRLVKDDKETDAEFVDTIAALDPKFYGTTAIALNSAYDALKTVLQLATANIQKALSLFDSYDAAIIADIEKDEDNIDMLTDKISNYLINLSPQVKVSEQSRIISQYLSVATEFERLGDHAVNISESATSLKENAVAFSEIANKELAILKEIIAKVLDYSAVAFVSLDENAARKIEPLEEVIDDLTVVLKNNHINRLENGQCNVIVGTVFLNLLSDIERISDVCSNIGIATVARKNPKLADEAHNYISYLHQGSDEYYNVEYNKAHQEYFERLELVENS